MKKNRQKMEQLRRQQLFGGNASPWRGYLFRFSFLSVFYGGAYCKVEIDFRKKGESKRALQLLCVDGKLVNWLNTDVNQEWFGGVRKRRNKGVRDAQVDS